MSSVTTYGAAVDRIRRPAAPTSSGTSPDLRDLVRLGTLAASSHNTQPWTFEIADGVIRIRPDVTRRCPVVDPDDAHLYKSLGCAAENVVHAATVQGLRADVEYDANADAVVVRLTADPACHETELARAIVRRQCTKAAYDGRPLDAAHLGALQRAGTGRGARVLTFTRRSDTQAITDFVNRGNLAQLSDPAWRRELLAWIRPNDRIALERGDGVSGRTSGQPSLPGWLARLLLPVIVKPAGQIKADRANITSSAGVAVFVTGGDHRAAWVEAGRCYERFALQATALEIRNAFINQPIEVAAIRPELERWLGLGDGEHAQLMVRFGTGSPMPFSMRRPVSEVIVGH